MTAFNARLAEQKALLDAANAKAIADSSRMASDATRRVLSRHLNVPRAGRTHR
jgi:hypothetical protein